MHSIIVIVIVIVIVVSKTKEENGHEDNYKYQTMLKAFGPGLTLDTLCLNNDHVEPWDTR